MLGMLRYPVYCPLYLALFLYYCNRGAFYFSSTYIITIYMGVRYLLFIVVSYIHLYNIAYSSFISHANIHP